MITLYQFKHGLAAHKDIEEAFFKFKSVPISGPVMNIKLALKLILSNIGWLQLIGGMGRQYFLHNNNNIDAL